MLKISPINAFNDNYIWLIQTNEGNTLVDPGDSKPIISTIDKLGITIDDILITHHHFDHTGGLELLKPHIRGSVIGPKNKISNQDLNINLDHSGQVSLELSHGIDRQFTGQEIITRWRELTGTIADVKDLTFSASLNPAQPDLNIEFSGYDLSQLTSAANALKEILSEYDGSYDIRDSISSAKRQANISLRNNAMALDLSLKQVLSQVHNAYQGRDVQNIQTQDDEITVWLGLPEDERSSMWYLENLPIKLFWPSLE